MVQLYITLLIIAVKLTAGNPEWKLAFNIHGADGHNFGYASKEWQDNSDVGSAAYAFSADYKSYDVTLETANFIAIVRHQDGVCDAARVWEFQEVGKTLQFFLDYDQTSRKIVTNDYIFSYISPTMVAKELDPIFNVKGALVFNWWYHDNAVRIGNSNNYCDDSGLPGEGVDSNNFWGLGNEQTGSTRGRTASTSVWFDAGIQNCDVSMGKRVQGSDHGTSLKDGTFLGQYAVYVSDEAKEFHCEGIDLKISMDARVMQFFNLIDKGDDSLLSYDEVIFNYADYNKDNFLSMAEYSDARADYMFGETATDANVLDDFERVDKNHDGVLTFLEIAFDSADSNKDGKLSIPEYAETRAQELLGGSGTDKNTVKDFHRIDKDGDESLIFSEIAFDAVDTNKDGELSVGEYSLSHAEEYIEDSDKN